MSIGRFFIQPFSGNLHRGDWLGQDSIPGFDRIEGLLQLRSYKIQGSEEQGPKCAKGRWAYVSFIGVGGIVIWLTKCSFGEDLVYFGLVLLRAWRAKDWC